MDIRRATDITVLAHVLVLLGLAISGSISGIWTEIIYIAAFLLPTALGIFVGVRCGARPMTVSIKKDALPLALFAVFPTVLLILGISVLTTLFLESIGAESTVTVYETLGENIVRHAILPAILEEAVFRYLPMSLYGMPRMHIGILCELCSYSLLAFSNSLRSVCRIYLYIAQLRMRKSPPLADSSYSKKYSIGAVALF